MRFRPFLRSTVFLLAILLPGISCAVAEAVNAQPLRDGTEFTFHGCYARLDNSQLILGNAHVRRAWRIEEGHLFAISFLDLDSKVEWMNVPSPLPSPSAPVPVEGDRAVMRGASGAFGPTEAASLRVELEISGSGAVVDYEFQIFPDASGVRMWTKVSGSTPAASDQAKQSSMAGSQPVSDALENLQITNPNLRLTQVILHDRTDQHNELVFENEWLLHANEAKLELQGNLFILENILTGDGLIFLKEAPQPEMRPMPTAFDALFSGTSMTTAGKQERKTPPFYRLSFYGNGFAATSKGYPYILMSYRGGRMGRIAALQHYQRQIRQYVPGRDGLLLSNTWGDRSLELKLNEDFIRREIDAGHALGVDVVQIDGGWQAGKTSGLSTAGGVWEGYWKTDPHFWDVNSSRFPHGLSSLSNYAHECGMKLGLWFAPDSSDDFANWRKDADQLLRWNKEDHVDAFKLDSVDIRSQQGQENYHALLDTVQAATSGNVLLDLDVTAETRPGYFGTIAAGPLFVENRYTDWHNYWPHQTLRNFWKLAQYVDPVHLRMEFLNSERNRLLYSGDPLAPANYRASYLFATVMFASPLAWFENTGLSASYAADLKPLIVQWKQERDAIYRGTTIPIGDAPDGVAWTGFASITEGGRGGYLLAFRELNEESTWLAPGALFGNGEFKISVLGGDGTVTQEAEGFRVSIPQKPGFVWVKLEPVQ